MSGSPTTIIGNVTADPELRFGENGTPRLTFSVAVGHYWTDQKGEKQEKTSFVDVVAWRYLAEDAARVLEKGVRVVVAGRLDMASWEKDGQKRSKLELIADEIGLGVKSVESFERRVRAEGNGQKSSASKPRQSASPARTAPKGNTLVEEDEPF